MRGRISPAIFYPAKIPRPSMVQRQGGRSTVGAHRDGMGCRLLWERPRQVEILGGKGVARSDEQGRSHLPRRADGGAGGAPSAWLEGSCKRHVGARETVQLRHDTAKGLRLRGRPLWKGFRVLGAARPRLTCRSAVRRAAHGAAHGGEPSALARTGKPACANGEGDWRERLAEARAIGEARELKRRGRTLAPGRGC